MSEKNGSPAAAPPRKMIGRERTDGDARLNAFKPVQLGHRARHEEVSWVLFDKNDPRHADIPGHILSERDLPRGALVISVDMGPLPQAEIAAIRERDGHRPDRPPTPIAPQAHAIYITGGETELGGVKTLLSRDIDKRTHDRQPYTRESFDGGAGVLWDRPEPGDTGCNYHMRVSGNNHPEAPVKGLRRLATGAPVYKMLERMSMEGLAGLEFAEKRALGDKPGLMSPYLARELGKDIGASVMRATGQAEEGVHDRMKWPEGNAVEARIARLEESDRRMIADAEAEKARRTPPRPAAKHADRTHGEGNGRQPAGSGWDAVKT